MTSAIKRRRCAHETTQCGAPKTNFGSSLHQTVTPLVHAPRPWWGDGDLAWLFDNAEDALDLDARTVGFDMTQVLDEPMLRTPVMMYLFHRVEQRLDGHPTIIVIDEGWKALDDDVFVARIKDWEKTIRKRNGVVGFATQSAQDALESRIASAIVEQAATQIFMANPKAQARDYMQGFGLTEHEFGLVRSLPDTSRCFLIKHGADSCRVLNSTPQHIIERNFESQRGRTARWPVRSGRPPGRNSFGAEALGGSGVTHSRLDPLCGALQRCRVRRDSTWIRRAQTRHGGEH